MGRRQAHAPGQTESLTERLVSFHPYALDEAVAATDWYEKRSPRAAELFLNEVDRVIARALGYPEQFPLDFGIRRAMLRRFPFLVLFRETDGGIEIVAIAHSRRRPGYWRDRI